MSWGLLPRSVLLLQQSKHIRDKEIHYPWKKRWSEGKGCFLQHFLLIICIKPSHTDLFHLSLWLSPPPTGVAPLPHHPPCIYTCVLSVCCQFVLFVKPASVFRLIYCFSPVSDFDPCLSHLRARLPDHSACPCPWAWLLSCTFASTLDYRPLPALTCRLPAPVVTTNIATSHSLHLGLALIPDIRIQGKLNQHGYHSILQQYTIPSGLCLVGLSFVFQQNNHQTHLQAV